VPSNNGINSDYATKTVEDVSFVDLTGDTEQHGPDGKTRNASTNHSKGPEPGNTYAVALV
jgi:hypothetical protein